MSEAVRVPVDVPGAAYEVIVGDGVMVQLGAALAELHPGARALVITDETVRELFADGVSRSLETAGVTHDLVAVPPGETSKSWEVAGNVLEHMASAGLERGSVVVALGGGVVGDLAGFCAAVYMRGIAFVQVPTTLLAQVDSSVGGKTAVDLRAGKNLAGAFKQPLAVLADTATLVSLPEREWSSGVAEVVKTALLQGEEFLAWLESNAGPIMARDPQAVSEMVARAVAFKASVVVADEREEGVREHLNLGHTLGHAIEKVAGYGSVTHGQAVADGLRFATRLAERALGASPEITARTGALLDRFGLGASARAWDATALRHAMSSDKKARGARPRFVLVRSPGDVVVTDVDERLLTELLNGYTQVDGAGPSSGEGER